MTEPAAPAHEHQQFWSLFPTEQAVVDKPSGWKAEPGRTLRAPGWIGEWERPVMIRDPRWKGRPWPDYLSPVNLPCLCSPRLRELFDRVRGPSDEIEWLRVDVTEVDDDEAHEYWMMRLPVLLREEILDEDRTVWSPGTIMKAVVDARKMTDRHVVRYPSEMSTRPIVCDAVRAAIEQAGMAGCKFEPVPATHLARL